MSRILRILSTVLAVSYAACNIAQVVSGIRSLQTPVRGTNLGSWFILEEWMINSLWNNNNCDPQAYQGQYQFEQCLRNQGKPISSILEQHWSTWITEADFQRMSSVGVNAVRIPVGWWQIYDPQNGANNAQLNQYISPSNYQTGALKYLDKAFDWAEKYGIAVFIDMHAAPGSQNGNDHSSPAVVGVVNWDKYQSNMDQTVDSMGLYAQRYKNRAALLGFGLLNEPACDIPKLQQYYQNAYNRIMSIVSPNPTVIVISPLINPYQFGTEAVWTGFMNLPNVWMNMHFYYCFPAWATTGDQLAGAILGGTVGQIESYKSVNPKPLIVDEMSTCGSPVGAEAQMMAAENTAFSHSQGWMYWSWKLEGDGRQLMSLSSAINNGWVTPNMMASCPLGADNNNRPTTSTSAAAAPPTQAQQPTGNNNNGGAATCNGQAYSTSQYTCTINDVGQQVLCPSGQSSCGSACYPGSTYCCLRGALAPKNQCPAQTVATTATTRTTAATTSSAPTSAPTSAPRTSTSNASSNPSSCNGQPVGPGYTCTTNDRGQNVLCQSGNRSCGSACYSPTQYCCRNGQLVGGSC